jgi:hypothetical protein
LVQVMAGKVEVFDPKTLRGQLEQRKIRFVPHQSEYCWAYQLIARGARVISNLEAYGMVLLPEFRETWAATRKSAKQCAMLALCLTFITLQTWLGNLPLEIFCRRIIRPCKAPIIRWKLFSKRHEHSRSFRTVLAKVLTR